MVVKFHLFPVNIAPNPATRFASPAIRHVIQSFKLNYKLHCLDSDDIMDLKEIGWGCTGFIWLRIGTSGGSLWTW
jgi:hypothetical protein